MNRPFSETEDSWEMRAAASEHAAELVVPVLLQRAADAPHGARDGDTDAGGNHGIFDRGRSSVVFDEAENRLHIQKAILVMLMGGGSHRAQRRNSIV